MVLNGKFLQEYPVNAGVSQGSILGPPPFLLYINDDVICGIAIFADDTTIYSKCDQASDLWQHLKLASELESALSDTVSQIEKKKRHCLLTGVRSGLLISMLRKLCWFGFTSLITMVLLM